MATTLLATSFAGPAIAAAPSQVSIEASPDPQDNHPLLLTAIVSPADVDFWTDATIDFLDGGLPIASCENVPVEDDNATTCEIPDPAAGAHAYKAAYSGNVNLDPSESPVIDVVVAADTVDAAGVGRDLPTFYPVRDGYLDVLTISGERLEPIEVTIRIYNADNRKVKEVQRAEATGGYSFAWNGRNAAGTILAAGRYRIVQVLTDDAGTASTFTSYSNLSHKKLVTKTAYITKNGTAESIRDKFGTGGFGESGGTLQMRAGSDGAVLAGWQLRIPDAVSYSSIAFQVDTQARTDNAAIYIHNFSLDGCEKSATWYLECFDKGELIGNASGSRRWYSVGGSTSRYRSGTTVRGLMLVLGGTSPVYHVRAKVVYQTLK